MDAWTIKIERCDPGHKVSQDSFNFPAPLTDLTNEIAQRCTIQGVVRTTPAHLIYALALLSALAQGYTTGLSTVESDIASLAP